MTSLWLADRADQPLPVNPLDDGVRFADVAVVGAGLTGAVRAFNSAVGSWESRLSPQLNRMSEQSGGSEIVGPIPIEEAVREVQESGLRVAG